jgi:hypothetical protein
VVPADLHRCGDLSAGSGLSVAAHFGANCPQAGTTQFGSFAHSLELAAVGAGEGGGASHPELDQVLVVEVFVLSVAVRVQVDVGQRPPVGRVAGS